MAPNSTSPLGASWAIPPPPDKCDVSPLPPASDFPPSQASQPPRQAPRDSDRHNLQAPRPDSPSSPSRTTSSRSSKLELGNARRFSCASSYPLPEAAAARRTPLVHASSPPALSLTVLPTPNPIPRLMERTDSQKRSKAQLAKSLLQRGSSRQDVTEGTDAAAAASSAGSPSASATSLSSSTLAPSAASHPGGQRQSKHRPHLSMTMSSSGKDGPPGAPPSPNRPRPATSPLSTKAASIEQSVRLFRIFEALRSGDTAAINKALREQGGAGAETTADDSSPSTGKLEGTSVLHLAVQCAESPVIEYILNTAASSPDVNLDVDGRDRDGNTPLHVAASLGRAPVVRMLLDQKSVDDSLLNFQGQTALDLARTPEIFQQLQLARSIYIDDNIKTLQALVVAGNYADLEKLLTDPRIRTTVDVNGAELSTDPATVEHGGTLLHEAARKRDTKLIQLLLLNGADPFRRDRKGKLPQDVTKDDKTRAILKRSPAAAAAQRGIQEKAILGGAPPQAASGPASSEAALSSKEGREIKGYLKKWTNYTTGYKLRWFVLEDGVLSYYKHQDDAGSACRGAINMKIAKLHMDPQDKLRFEIHGKSSVKYHLKANHQVEAKRWFWALNNAIQWSKDEAREEERRQTRESEALRQAKLEQFDKQQVRGADVESIASSRVGGKGHQSTASLGIPYVSAARSAPSVADDASQSGYEPSGPEMTRVTSHAATNTIDGDLDDDEYPDDASSRDAQPAAKDAFNITAQSARIQLDLLAQVSAALQSERSKNPTMSLSEPISIQALTSFEAAVSNLKGLVGDLLRISRDRDAYWQYRFDREADVRRMWEESMTHVAREQEALESRIGESEDKRKRTKRALRDALSTAASKTAGRGDEMTQSDMLSSVEEASPDKGTHAEAMQRSSLSAPLKVDLQELSDSGSEADDEFFDAVDAGEVEVVDIRPTSPGEPPAGEPRSATIEEKATDIVKSFKGYEDPPRKRLKMDQDNRPKISLWGILKSMIGKDMTKMTLPVSFNEPTSLLQRVAEDMEYTDLLDTAADRADSTERMVYVAAFAASEYASTIGRVAKPFNPLLGETFEYARPDKGYRFFVEQVSHHPPIGAAWAESPKWDYYGESAVRSKFYGKSFDINPLGTWFLRLRPTNGAPAELYTWKKVTTSVIGIITGNPTVDNYGLMEIRNWTTNETCTLDFKPRGWKSSSAYQVAGKVSDAAGATMWTVGGRWNDKIYARHAEGYDGPLTPPPSAPSASALSSTSPSPAFLIWEANPRPKNIPFNLTPFGLTLNALPDRLQPHLAPTDTRLRPDQRAMEDGEYDRAASEKNRVEEKQRARRRERDATGEEHAPRWFRKSACSITGESFWEFTGEYWQMRDRAEAEERERGWEGCEDIF